MSSSPPTNAAVWGMGCSGVVVARAMTSMSRGASFADSKAARAAFVASVAVDSCDAATRRSRMPVFSRIHPSSTPKWSSSTALPITVGGTSAPQPANRNGVMRVAMGFPLGFRCSRAGADERLLDLHGPVDGFVDGVRDRDEVERLAACLEIRSEMLADVLGPTGRAVPLERLVREPVEALHRIGQSGAGGFDVGVEPTPDLHGVLPADRAASGPIGMLGDERDRLPEPACRGQHLHPAVAQLAPAAPRS